MSFEWDGAAHEERLVPQLYHVPECAVTPCMLAIELLVPPVVPRFHGRAATAVRLRVLSVLSYSNGRVAARVRVVRVGVEIHISPVVPA